MDRIIISGLKVNTVIGTLPEERTETQKLIINLELYLPLQNAGTSDNLFDSVDYSRVEAEIIELGEKSKFSLIERFAEKTAELCLKNDLVSRVKVEVVKPGALRHSQSVAVVIERSR